MLKPPDPHLLPKLLAIGVLIALAALAVLHFGFDAVVAEHAGGTKAAQGDTSSPAPSTAHPYDPNAGGDT